MDLVPILKQSIAYIKSEQDDDGSFVSLSSADRNNFSRATPYRTTFFTANILACLNTVCCLLPDICDDVDGVREQAADFLLKEKGANWSFNYWSRASKEREVMPYPDDLDDTFAALVALHGFDKKLITGEALASVAKLLAAVEVAPGGPYRTWLVGDSAVHAWRDVDVAVNSNVSYLLSLAGISLPNLALYIDGKISSGAVASRYYPGMIQVAYFLSRGYAGQYDTQLAEVIFRARGENGLWESPLESAMAISALINLGFAEKISEDDVAVFAGHIVRESFRPYAFCIDPSRDGRRHYAGASALTAAFSAEAFARWIYQREVCRGMHGLQGDDLTVASSAEKTSYLGKIKSMMRERTRGLAWDLKCVVDGAIDTMKTHEAAILPVLVQRALGKSGESISRTLVDEFALANVYGWMAYSIYDDFLDGEGDPMQLSAANFFLRELTAAYSGFGSDAKGIFDWYRRIMNAIDNANTWEQSHCRMKIENGMLALPKELPEIGVQDLADRSLGHALPALAMLFAAGCPSDSHDAKAYISFFRYYLAARQLHDDAHDWAEDLSRGQLNAASVRLLTAWCGSHDDQSETVGCLDVTKQLSELKKFFWRTVIPDIVAEIGHYLNRAREELAVIKAVENPAPLEGLLDRLQSAAMRTASERDRVMEFLNAYWIGA